MHTVARTRLVCGVCRLFNRSGRACGAVGSVDTCVSKCAQIGDMAHGCSLLE